ncbi:hypothetical protein ACJRO7_028472 [Eucalyptus globulus]|uniref:Uncharacterized protein n=1 Tax=Eucalyptus globulus TaxID=34317 RepID=A0ABD3JVV2_EUCGL
MGSAGITERDEQKSEKEGEQSKTRNQIRQENNLKIQQKYKDPKLDRKPKYLLPRISYKRTTIYPSTSRSVPEEACHTLEPPPLPKKKRRKKVLEKGKENTKKNGAPEEHGEIRDKDDGKKRKHRTVPATDFTDQDVEIPDPAKKQKMGGEIERDRQRQRGQPALRSGRWVRTELDGEGKRSRVAEGTTAKSPGSRGQERVR